MPDNNKSTVSTSKIKPDLTELVRGLRLILGAAVKNVASDNHVAVQGFRFGKGGIARLKGSVSGAAGSAHWLTDLRDKDSNDLVCAGVYVRQTLVDSDLYADDVASGRARPKSRGTGYSASHFGAFLADMDIVGDGHKTKRGYRDHEHVKQAVAESGLPEPTGMINSGGGIYPVWQLDAPLDCRKPEERALAVKIQKGILWTLTTENGAPDITADLARVWRLPGTPNRKRNGDGTSVYPEGTTCRVLFDDGPTYSAETLLVACKPLPEREVTVRSFDGDAASGEETLRAFTGWAWSRIKRAAADNRGGQTNQARTALGKRARELADAGQLTRDQAVATFESTLDRAERELDWTWGSGEQQSRAYTEEDFARAFDHHEGYGGVAPWRSDGDLVGIPDFETRVRGDVKWEDLRAALVKIEDGREVRNRIRRDLWALLETTEPSEHASLRETLKQDFSFPIGEFDKYLRDVKSEQRKIKRESKEAEQEDAAESDRPFVKVVVSDHLAFAKFLLHELGIFGPCDPTPGIRYSGSRFYIYTGKYWKRESTEYIESVVQTALGNTDCAFRHKGILARQNTPVSDLLVKGVVKAISREVFHNDSGGSQTHLALNNGILDPKTRELLAHTKDAWVTGLLDYDYDPDAECPVWDNLLATAFEHDPASVDLLNEYGGYVLLSDDYPFHKMLTMTGSGRAGKGTITRALTGVVGEKDCGVASIKQFSRPEDCGRLHQYRLITVPEAKSKWDGSGSGGESVGEDVCNFLKAWTGQDEVSVRNRYGDPFDVRINAKPLLIGNDAPTFKDPQGVLLRRLMRIEFLKSYYGKEDIELGSKLRAERSGILNRLLEGLARLLANGRFTENEGTQTLHEDLCESTSPMVEFFDPSNGYVGYEAGSELKTFDLYHAYLGYRLQSGDLARFLPSSKSFGKSSAVFLRAAKVSPRRTDTGKISRVKIKVDGFRTPSGDLGDMAVQSSVQIGIKLTAEGRKARTFVLEDTDWISAGLRR